MNSIFLPCKSAILLVCLSAISAPCLSVTLTEPTIVGERNPKHPRTDHYRDDHGELFAEARDTEGNASAAVGGNEADTNETRADEVGALAEHGPDPAMNTPASVLSSVQGGCGGVSGAGRAEEWCAGHVCLRLRPDGLREKPGDRGEAGDDGSSEDGSGSGSGSDESREGEVRLYVQQVGSGFYRRHRVYS